MVILNSPRFGMSRRFLSNDTDCKYDRVSWRESVVSKFFPCGTCIALLIDCQKICHFLNYYGIDWHIGVM